MYPYWYASNGLFGMILVTQMWNHWSLYLDIPLFVSNFPIYSSFGKLVLWRLGYECKGQNHEATFVLDLTTHFFDSRLIEGTLDDEFQ